MRKPVGSIMMTLEPNPIKRFYKKPGRKAAIEAFCAYCCGVEAPEQGNGHRDHLEPGFRIAIKQCTATGCPLYRYRPYQG